MSILSEIQRLVQILFLVVFLSNVGRLSSDDLIIAQAARPQSSAGLIRVLYIQVHVLCVLVAVYHGYKRKYTSMADMIFFCISTPCLLLSLIMFLHKCKTANVRMTYNHCCSRKKTMIITYSVYVFVALGIQHAMRVRHNVIYVLPCSYLIT